MVRQVYEIEERLNLSDTKTRRPIQYQISDSGCWNCISHSETRGGYLQLGRNGKKQRVHRYVYKLFKRIDIPSEIQVCHTCDNRKCINPNHMFLGTAKDNVWDMIKKGRQPKGETNSRAKLTNEIAAAIRSDTRTLSEIAKDYNLSFGHVGAIRRGEKWNYA